MLIKFDTTLLMIVIFSIGNPGAITRHSVGHFMLNRLLEQASGHQLQKSGSYAISKVGEFVFVKSNVAMNESNKAFSAAKRDLRISADTPVFVLYDDFESKLGVVKLNKFKKNESHNGINSIKNGLGGAENIYKLGVGIGPKPNQALSETMGDWVLSAFNLEEKHVLERTDLMVYLSEFLSREVVDFGKFNLMMAKRNK